MNKTIFQKKVMYRLKRDYGIRLSYYQPTQNDHDLKTGEIDRDYIVFNIRRALVFETKQLRDFVYDLSFIAANKNFTMGGHFDAATRVVAIHKDDFPSTFVPNLNDHVVVKHRRFEMKEFSEIEDEQIIAFKVEEVKGLIVREFHTVSLESVVTAAGEVA